MEKLSQQDNYIEKLNNDNVKLLNENKKLL